MAQKLRKTLIANRGEIACRIQRACRKLGIASVSICSEVDQNSLFARNAEELVVIGPAAPQASYLAIDKIVRAALDHGCDSVHPGYGFLSENGDFAEAVRQAGLIFIGPSTETIRLMGSKTGARKKVTEFGVPCTPGTLSGLGDAELLSEAEQIGFPVIVKAVAGGGGRGMRIAHTLDELRDALPRARAEGKKNFASEDVYLEKFIVNPRHVEVQIFGDSHGNFLHFGTRDCSLQRRHQKLVEEAPAPFLSDELRERIHQAGLDAARSVNYQNAGTVELLVSGDQFYFLEMNTRIQVEHPVTEAVTGVDLVELQFKVAQGEALPLTQSDVGFSGHAIEFRIYAEDPAAGFVPTAGTIEKLERPQSEGLREDGAVEEGDKISVFYDAMISKIIVSAESRSACMEKSREILSGYVIKGLTTTLDYHLWLTYNSGFRNRPVDIGFVERELRGNPDFIREYRASRIRDPLHQEPIGGAEVKNVYQYVSKKFGETYTIEVVHKADGSFLLIPMDLNGERAAREEDCRRSNGFQKALSSVIKVLETKSPQELFAHCH